jgi:hypothetical protein
VSEAARRLLNLIVSGRQARLPGPAGLRRLCLTALIALVVQFGLGMILNLYITIPASDQNAGFVQEVKTAPLILTIHVLLGIALICAAGVLFIRAIGDRDRVMIAMTATGLAAILGAYAAGEVFVRNGQNSESLTMAILTGVALLSYIGMLAVIGASPAQIMRMPLRPAAASRPDPGDAVAAVPLPRPVNRLSGPQRRLGHPPAPEPRPAYAAAAAPRTRPSYPAADPQTDSQLRAARQTGPQPRAANRTGPRPGVGYETGPQPRAAHQTGPQPRAVHQTGPQPRATYPYPPAAPYPQRRRPQTAAGRDHPPWEDPASTTP